VLCVAWRHIPSGARGDEERIETTLCIVVGWLDSPHGPWNRIPDGAILMEVEQIRNAGLKVTAPRVKILALLEDNSDDHFSAEDVYKMLLNRGEEIGIATIYRVLTQFEGVGLVKRHYFDSGTQAIFELNRGSHHDHILCQDCGQVVEFVDEVIEKRQHAIARDNGFKLTRHALVLYAECKREDCPNRTT
jgi:Fur family ferric uptake transcriptional regulator